MKRQCPSCKSYNEEHSVFCDQCGAKLVTKESRALSRSSKEKAVEPFKVETASPGGSRWLFLVLGILILGGGGAFLFEKFSGQSTDGTNSTEFQEPIDLSSLEKIDSTEGIREVVEIRTRSQDTEKELEPLPFHRLRPLVQRALTELKLYDEFESQLSPVTGIYIGGDGLILTRFSGLLGAQKGIAETWGRSDLISIIGVVQVDIPRDLALIQVRSNRGSLNSNVAFPGISYIAPNEITEYANLGTEVLVVARENPGARDWVRSQVDKLEDFSFDGYSRIRLDRGSYLNEDFIVVVDNFGYFLGLGLPEAIQPTENVLNKKLLVDPIGDLHMSMGQALSWTLPQLSAQYWEGTFAAFLHRGNRCLSLKLYERASENLFSALDVGGDQGVLDHEIESAKKLLRKALIEYRGQLRKTRSWRELTKILETSVEYFSDWREAWVELALAYNKLQDYPNAIRAALEAREVQDGDDVYSVLVQTYNFFANQLVDRGDTNRAAETLLEGIENCPRSGRLHMSLGKIYFSWEYLEDAERLFKVAAELEPALSQESKLFLEKIDDVLSRKNMAIVPITNARRIQTDLLLNGAAQFNFTIDTGASMTSITQSMAHQLGYDERHMNRKVKVRAVNSEFIASILKLDSLSLQGFTVRDLDVIVLPDGEPTLLGLNFLNHFRYTVDAKKGEFRLEGR